MVSEGEVARFYATIGADTSGLTRGVAQARAQMAGLGASATQSVAGVGSAFRSLGGLALLGGGALAVGTISRALSDGVRAVMSYETAFVGVRKTVDASEAQFDKLDATIRRMASTSLPLGRDELARIATIGGQMNVPIEQMENFINTVAKFSLASGGVLDADAAAAGLGKLLPLMNLPLQYAENVASAVAQVADTIVGDEAIVLDIATRSAGTQRLAGFTPAQTLALAGAGSQLGNPEAVGGALTNAPTQISKIVSEGGDNLAALALISGVTSEQFKKQWETDAFGAFQLFTQGIGRLGEGVFPALEEMGLGGLRVGQVLIGLAGNWAAVEASLAAASGQLAEPTRIQEEFAKQAETSAAQLALFKGQLTETSDLIAGPLVQAMTDAMPVVAGFMALLTGATISPEKGGVGGFIKDVIGNIPLIEGTLKVWDTANDKAGSALKGVTGIDLTEGAGPMSITDMLRRKANIENTTRRLEGFDWDSDEAAGFGDFGVSGGNGIPTEGSQVKQSPSDASRAVIDQINSIFAKAPSTGGAAAKISEEQKLTNQIEEKHTQELVEAYIKGGDKRVAVVRSEQQRLNAEWGGVAQALHDKLGIAVPEEFRLMWEAAQKETEKGKQGTLSGLLGFLAARDTEHGANPLSNKFKMGDGATYVVQGDVNVGLRPDIPGGVDVNAAITVADRVDYTQVR